MDLRLLARCTCVCSIDEGMSPRIGSLICMRHFHNLRYQLSCSASQFAVNLLSGRWSCSAIYAYPGFIDELPPGTCILNDSPLREKNFPLAGSKLSNKVVTSFEAPQEITPGFISSRRIDYIVQIAPLIAPVKDTSDSSLAALPNPLPAPKSSTRPGSGLVWRIWKVRTWDSIAEKSR